MSTMTARRILLLCCFSFLTSLAWSYTTLIHHSYAKVPNLAARHSKRSVTSKLPPTFSQEPAQHFSPLFSNSSSNNGDKPNKRNPLVSLQKALTRLTSSGTRFLTQFRRLSRRAKVLVVTQCSVLLLILGMLTRRMYVNHYHHTATTTSSPIEVPYSTFLDFSEGKHKNVKITNILIGPERIAYKLYKVETEEQRKALLENSKSLETIPQQCAFTRKVSASPELLQHLRHYSIPFSAAPIKPNYTAMSLRTILLGFYALLLIRMYRTMSGGGGGSGNSPGKLATSSTVTATSFDDIEGMDSAKLEVMELVDTLRNPDKYAILGARAPTGLLLEGPPGTGKTMLARATAATAGVPLLYCSGSDFVEMFVGRGAARVRNMFDKAAKLSPCIIFIDELDALGKSRDSGMMGMTRGNDEAEQTLNQLLACMDGLDSSKRICVMAATNRKDVLDSALVRPGRFDRIIKLELPSTAGREKILRVHANKLPGFKEGTGIDDKRPGSLGKGRAVDLSAVASATPGLSGAELEFIVNEAAIRAVRRVSAELRDGVNPSQIVPTVEACDFEESVRNFFETRRSKAGGVGDLFRSLQK